MTWQGRFRTAVAMIQLLLAMALVHFVPMRIWRGYLGTLIDAPIASTQPADPAILKIASGHTLHVIRAASHFPFTVKCLPQAMVLQWQLRRRGIGSQLVIAMLKAGRSAALDPYHAWVELGGIMVLGNCERSDYAVLMTLTNPPA
ncbi:MAG: lasso peptide biosynthesis B2 protein [Novosphingobium sp.]